MPCRGSFSRNVSSTSAARRCSLRFQDIQLIPHSLLIRTGRTFFEYCRDVGTTLVDGPLPPLHVLIVTLPDLRVWQVALLASANDGASSSSSSGSGSNAIMIFISRAR